MLLAATCLLATAPLASAETRTLKLYYLHTREKAEITYKKNGKFLPSGLKQLNNFLRDWRRNEPTKMDPRLFDLVWEVYRATGARDYIHVVSAYRSPATNSMLRKRGRGVAEKSQHMLGKAMDFFIPGVKLKDLRYAGLRVQGGGVGYYPTSGSPFVHLDVGNVRHWPKMSRTELASVFPGGKTMHVPSDGKPMPGYDQAVAAYQKRKGAGIALASAETTKSKGGGFLSALFGGGGADEEEETGGAFGDSTPKPSVAVASAAPTRQEVAETPVAAAVAPPPEPVQSAETIIAALPLRDVPTPMFAPRPSADVGPAAAAVAAVTAVEDAPLVEAPVTVAENVPIPLPRPAYTPPVTQVASAGAPVNAIAGQDASSAGELAIETVLARDNTAVDAAGVPVPVTRPVVLAALNADQTATDAPNGTVQVAAAGVRPASPRDALRGKPGDPVAAIGAGPATTPKSAKPVSSDSKPDAKAISVPVQTETVGRALVNTAALPRQRKPDGKAFAVSTLRSAPSEVYTAGFQQVALASNQQGFTGKAVTFMPVAKFRTN
jgi:uncharacterized protein YcbK (DUF882 family)